MKSKSLGAAVALAALALVLSACIIVPEPAYVEEWGPPPGPVVVQGYPPPPGYAYPAPPPPGYMMAAPPPVYVVTRPVYYPPPITFGFSYVHGGGGPGRGSGHGPSRGGPGRPPRR
ncbi:MAG: hypothetical protein AAB215_06270 [Planctomycetota bacterium]